MTSPTVRPHELIAADEADVRALCRQLWDAWNERSAGRFAALFEDAGMLVGFDGSFMSGRTEIAAQLGEIFANHQTPAYAGIIRHVRFLAADVAVLRADVGMVPAGQAELNPQLNAVQMFVVARRGEGWRLAAFQNTPAQFHGRPELAERLTEELRLLL